MFFFVFYVFVASFLQGQRPGRRDESARGAFCEKRGRRESSRSAGGEKGQTWTWRGTEIGTEIGTNQIIRILSSSSSLSPSLCIFRTSQENIMCHDSWCFISWLWKGDSYSLRETAWKLPKLPRDKQDAFFFALRNTREGDGPERCIQTC